MTPVRIIKTGTKLLSVVSLDYHGSKYCIIWVFIDNSQQKCTFEMLYLYVLHSGSELLDEYLHCLLLALVVPLKTVKLFL